MFVSKMYKLEKIVYDYKNENIEQKPYKPVFMGNSSLLAVRLPLPSGRWEPKFHRTHIIYTGH